jgi:hypothetical protein
VPGRHLVTHAPATDDEEDDDDDDGASMNPR